MRDIFNRFSRRVAGSGLRSIQALFPALAGDSDMKARVILNAIREAILDPTSERVVSSTPIKGQVAVGGGDYEYERGVRVPYTYSHNKIVKGTTGAETTVVVSSNDLTKSLAKNLGVGAREVSEGLSYVSDGAVHPDFLSAISKGLMGYVSTLSAEGREELLLGASRAWDFLDPRYDLEGLSDSLSYEIKVRNVEWDRHDGLRFVVVYAVSYEAVIPLKPEDDY